MNNREWTMDENETKVFFHLVALVGLVMESLHYNNIYASQSHAKFLL